MDSRLLDKGFRAVANTPVAWDGDAHLDEPHNIHMVLLLPGLPRQAQAALLRCRLPEAVQGCTIYGLGGAVDRGQLVQQALKALEVCCKALRGRIRGLERAELIPQGMDTLSSSCSTRAQLASGVQGSELTKTALWGFGLDAKV